MKKNSLQVADTRVVLRLVRVMVCAAGSVVKCSRGVSDALVLPVCVCVCVCVCVGCVQKYICIANDNTYVTMAVG